MVQEKPFETVTEDGVLLKGVLIVPESPKAVVQFNAGTAIHSAFYRPFLQYLAQQGYLCCSWDYRATGQSLAGSLAQVAHYRYSDYGRFDMPAVKRYLRNQYPDLPFFLLGHSAGGQQIGLMPDLDGVCGMIGFAAASGYLKAMPCLYLPKAYFFFYLFSPVSTALTGYVKAKPFKIMENLPAGVVKEWRDWCSRRDFLFDADIYGKSIPKGHYGALTFPVHIYWASDDPLAVQKNIENFWSHVHSTRGIAFTRLDAKDTPLKKIDHSGFFRRALADTLWHDVCRRLDNWLAESGKTAEKAA